MESNLKKLLESVGTILKKQKELSKLRGENFNVFSILKMESKENETHSAFLGELLNPKGSHLMGRVFLELFYDELPKLPNRTFDVASAKIMLEKNVGVKNLKNKTGGRIDIYLWDKEGNTICIENKIYASDQEAQIERYVNHNKEKNAVYYLTLNKQKAKEYTAGDYKEGEHFIEIAYAVHIVNWLELCMEKSVEQPILRETIKQYILLIKKLTGTLTSNKMQTEVKNLIKANYLAAKSIESSLWKVEQEHALIFLKEMKEVIQQELKESDGFVVTIDEKLTDTYTGLHITHPKWNGIEMKLEGASKVPWSNSIFGIKAPEKNFDRDKLKVSFSEVKEFQEGYKSNYHWPFYRTILSFTNNENRARLFNEKQRQGLAKSIGETIVHLVQLSDKKLQDESLNKKDVALLKKRSVERRERLNNL